MLIQPFRSDGAVLLAVAGAGIPGGVPATRHILQSKVSSVRSCELIYLVGSRRRSMRLRVFRAVSSNEV